MNSVKINELPVAGAIGGTELLPLVQDGETRQAPVSTIVENFYKKPEIDGMLDTLEAQIGGLSNPLNIGAGNSLTLMPITTNDWANVLITAKSYYQPTAGYGSLMLSADGVDGNNRIKIHNNFQNDGIEVYTGNGSTKFLNANLDGVTVRSRAYGGLNFNNNASDDFYLLSADNGQGIRVFANNSFGSAGLVTEQWTDCVLSAPSNNLSYGLSIYGNSNSSSGLSTPQPGDRIISFVGNGVNMDWEGAGIVCYAPLVADGRYYLNKYSPGNWGEHAFADGVVLSQYGFSTNGFSAYESMSSGRTFIQDADISFASISQDLMHTGPSIGFFGASPTGQAAAISNPTDLASCITVLTALLTANRAYGLIAT
jgi:hypothetical protein